MRNTFNPDKFKPIAGHSEPRILSKEEKNSLFFIRSKSMPFMYIHFKQGIKISNENHRYVLKKGKIGACLFDNENSNILINQRPGLEKIISNQILK
jgi:hypothetical protein